MDMEENNNRHGNLNSSYREGEIIVEMNSNLMKTIQILQEDL